MARQYIRQVSLIVGDASGNGIDLSQMRIRFATKQFDLQTPNTAEIRVYNLSDDTANKVQKEFTKVELRAGYDGNFGTIFAGTVVQFRRGRENPTDKYMDLIVADGDVAYNWAAISTTLAAGYTPDDEFQAIAKAFEEHGIKVGYKPTFRTYQSPRGTTLYGRARDRLRDFCETEGMRWSIQNGKLQIIPKGQTMSQEAFVLRPDTGLIGMPIQTPSGIEARCLLNPNIRIGGRVQIDQSSVQQAVINQQVSAGALRYNSFLPKLAGDGLYAVFVAEHRGDTRGQDWYTDLICLAMDATVTPALLGRGLTAGAVSGS